MDKCKAISTPLEQGRKFQQLSENEKPIDVQHYQMIIGCLTNAAIMTTHPDSCSSSWYTFKVNVKTWKRSLDMCKEDPAIHSRGLSTKV